MNPFAVIWALLALAAFVSAIFWGAEWHYGTGAMSATMAWVTYKAD